MTKHIVDVYVPYISTETPFNPRARRNPVDTLQNDLLELREETQGLVECIFCDIHEAKPNNQTKPEVVEIIQSGGIDQLPLVYVDDTLVFKGQYPDKQELRDTLDSL